MPDAKANILVVFYSRDGSIEALAKAVSEGARQAGAEVRLRRVPDIVSHEVMAKVPGWEERSKKMLAEYGAPTPADAEWADGIIFGTPTRFGNTSAELKAFIDSLGGLWFQGKLNGKAAGAFTSTAGPHGGNETTVLSLYIPTLRRHQLVRDNLPSALHLAPQERKSGRMVSRRSQREEGGVILPVTFRPRTI